MKVNIVTIPEGYGSENKTPSAKPFEDKKECLSFMSAVTGLHFEELIDLEDHLEEADATTVVYVITSQAQIDELLVKFADDAFVVSLLENLDVTE